MIIVRLIFILIFSMLIGSYSTSKKTEEKVNEITTHVITGRKVTLPKEINRVCSNGQAQNQLIFGGEKRIRELIEGTLKQIDADLYVVLTGCSVDLAGDNTVAVVSGFQKKCSYCFCRNSRI
ncbi:hypothetical protein ACN077_09720 [Clostridium chromiireducens]|uniref:hypothetical protein n=1 Tax=Clostridium chromiireducens TaxID=225345 RepID=UPI003AF93874